MFLAAQRPGEGSWLAVDAVGADGARRNAWNGNAEHFEAQPGAYLRQFPSHRWIKLLQRVDRHPPLADRLARYLCWRARDPPLPMRIEIFRIIGDPHTPQSPHRELIAGAACAEVPTGLAFCSDHSK
jgi:hypothetical protein